MIAGNHENDKEYTVIATVIVEGGTDTAIAYKRVPGSLINKLETIIAEIKKYISERENNNM